MAERRRSARFALTLPMDAHVSVLQDVQIEHSGPNDITLLSAVPGVRGEELVLRIGPSDAVQMTLTGRTVNSEPRVLEGRMMHRIQLAMTGSIALSSGADAAMNSWRSGDPTAAVFVRKHPVRVVNLSRGGCLLELSTSLAVGIVATLHTGSWSPHAEAVRIDFLHARRGVSWPYVAGAEFLSLSTPASRSLRSTAARMEATSDASLAGFGEESGSGLTNPAASPFDLLAIVCAAASSGAPSNVSMRSPEAQSRAGSPLALVGGRTTMPSANETLGTDD